MSLQVGKKKGRVLPPIHLPHHGNTQSHVPRRIQIMKTLMTPAVKPMGGKNFQDAEEEREEGEVDPENMRNAAFPSFQELCSLPEEFVQTIGFMVIDFLRKLLYPVALLWVRKKWRQRMMERAREQFHTAFPVPSLAVMQTNQLFGQWTNLHSVIASMKAMVFEPGEFIIHQGDTSRSGAFYLASGHIEVRKKRNSKRKSLGLNNSIVVASELKAPIIVGEFTILTEEPRLATVVATTRCIVYILTREDFYKCFRAMEQSTQDMITDVSLTRRTAIMRQAYPLTVDKLRKVKLFNHWPDELLTKMIGNMEPLAIPKKGVICNMGDPAENLFYIANGTIGIYRPSPSGELTLLAKLSAGVVVGEMSLIFVQKRSATIIALTSADLFTLSKKAFTETLLRYPEVKKKTIQIASEQQEIWLERQKANFINHVQHVPFVNLAPREAVVELALQFKAKVYLHNEGITSHALLCDRIIIVTSGHAVVSGQNTELVVGESIGWSCLGSHRWEHLVVAHETVEVIYLAYDTYKAWLVKYGLYHEVLMLTMSLLHPRVYAEFHSKAVEHCRHLKNLSCFPVNTKPYFVRFATRVSTDDRAELPTSPKKSGMQTSSVMATHVKDALNDTAKLVKFAKEEPKKALPPVPAYKRVHPDDRNVFTRLLDKKPEHTTLSVLMRSMSMMNPKFLEGTEGTALDGSLPPLRHYSFGDAMLMNMSLTASARSASKMSLGGISQVASVKSGIKPFKRSKKDVCIQTDEESYIAQLKLRRVPRLQSAPENLESL
eukprot:PhF_6_TR547/c1_g1_i1/m.498